MLTEKDNTIHIVDLIIANIEKFGIERYDVSDVRKLKIINNKGYSSRILRRIVLVIENICPIFIRKIFKIKKTKFPTAYSHLIEAYLKIYKNNSTIESLYNIEKLIDEMLKTYYVEDNDIRYWKYEPNYLYVDNEHEHENKIISMPMHALARINIALIKYASLFKKDEYISLSVKSLKFALSNHNIFYYSSGAIGVSYFYNSSDCTINVNTEFAQWITMIPQEYRDEHMHNVLSGIIKLVVEEQNENGSWFYFSKEHMSKWGDKPSIDCHHTGTVLYNLVSIYKSKVLQIDEQNNLLEVINKGIEYYINSFFDKKTGQGITLINYRRPAGPVQYSEAIIALCEYITLGDSCDHNLYVQIKELLPKLVIQTEKLVIKKNGSVASEKIILWKNINSIRWGNGPVLQALVTYSEIIEIDDKRGNRFGAN